MRLTKYGKKEWMTAGIVCTVLIALFIALGICVSHAGYYLAGATLAVLVCFAGFFRDPSRNVPPDDDQLLAPADGLVKDIELISAADNKELGEFFGGDMLRIGIFLSVFDVHVNRAPCPMTVKLNFHKDGRYYDARDPRCGKENESQVIAGTASAGGMTFPMAVRQVSGAIARRIVCPVEPGTSLARGERYGMIKFGSRTEVYLPAKSRMEIRVRVGDRVAGGITVLAQVVPAPDPGAKTIILTEQK